MMTSAMFYPKQVRVNQHDNMWWLAIETDDGRDAIYIHFKDDMTQTGMGGFGLAVVRAAAKPGEWVEL